MHYRIVDPLYAYAAKELAILRPWLAQAREMKRERQL
jgi:hypothetical protein